MTDSLEPTLPADVCLLLRADAERCWLRREVLPVLREVEDPIGEIEGPPQSTSEHVDAALTYLEAMWNEAMLRARETDAAHLELCSRAGELNPLVSPAKRYHAAVRALRAIFAERVTPLVGRELDLAEHAGERAGSVKVRDERSHQNECGCSREQPPRASAEDEGEQASRQERSNGCWRAA